MKQHVAFAAAMAIAITAAVALRLPRLADRPMHCDEAVHAVKFRDLLERGSYRYDPREYHGPTLNYLTLPVAWVSRIHRFAQMDEQHLRLVPALCGISLVAAMALLRPFAGTTAAFLAAMLFAVSAPMVYFSRYYIQETLLVAFTWTMIVAAWRILLHSESESPLHTLSKGRLIAFVWRWRWAVMFGTSLGLMHATKETCVVAMVSLGAGVLAVRRDCLRGLLTKRAISLVIAGLFAILVSAVLMSNGCQNPRGIADSYLTYYNYFARARGHGEAAGHVYPPYYYLQVIFWHHTRSGTIWTELPLACLGVLGVATAVRRRDVPKEQRQFVGCVAVFTLVTWALYSLIPYKTPWCILSSVLGLLVLAGIGAAECVRRPATLIGRLLGGMLVGSVLLFSAWQAWHGSFVDFESVDNPYAYSPTTSDMPALAKSLDRLAAADDRGYEIPIQVIANEDDYWPLPWYLRAWGHVGWYRSKPVGGAAPIIIAQASQESLVVELLYQDALPGERFLYVPIAKSQDCDEWFLRRSVPLRAFIRLDLWDRAVTP